ncbi:hypothetical protein T02_11148 [Trichinella nativa]|uniref:Uncharacterized protein n=1 Tax=Trichinella nativa TaxID=6335 RepID=A0A0V1LGV5_9BILA|nr:hypothetical protein T02_11148 [Trichinella nativa]
MPVRRNDFIKKQLDEIRAIIVIQYAVNRPLQSCHNSCSHRNCLGLLAARSGHCGQRFSFIPLHPATVETKPINDCYSTNTLHGIILNHTDSEETLNEIRKR